MSDNSTWSLLLQLQQQARQAASMDALRFTIVTETRRLILYRNAFLLRRTGSGKMIVEAASNVAAIDRNAPLVQWLERVTKRLGSAKNLEEPQHVTVNDLPDADQSQWADWHAAHGYWQPLISPTGELLGGLWLSRDTEMAEPEQVLLSHVSEAFAHAWHAMGLRGGIRAASRSKMRRVIAAGVILAIVALMAVPVPLSVIAPAEVSPADPRVIAAPISGVIDEVLVSPNQMVAEGDELYRFVDEELLAAAEVSERALQAADAAFRRAQQQAFGDPQSKAEVALREAERALKQAEADYSRSQLDKITIRAPMSGLVLFSDRNELRGRPVQIGERVMILAEPDNVDLTIQVPVADAIALIPGAPVRFFLDIDPLNPVEAELERAAFEAAETPEGVFAYRAKASFTETDESTPRIGLKGSARISGDNVPLVLFLLRKPLAALRQMVGA